MSKLIIEMTSSGSIYDLNFRNLTKKHELITGEDPCSKVRSFLIDVSYNGKRDQNNDHADYDTFGENDMIDLAKVLGDLIKSKGHAYVFCFALQLAVRYETVTSEKKRRES